MMNETRNKKPEFLHKISNNEADLQEDVVDVYEKYIIYYVDIKPAIYPDGTIEYHLFIIGRIKEEYEQKKKW